MALMGKEIHISELEAQVVEAKTLQIGDRFTLVGKDDGNETRFASTEVYELKCKFGKPFFGFDLQADEEGGWLGALLSKDVNVVKLG